MIEVPAGSGFARWRERARQLLAANVPPDAVIWVDSAEDQRTLPIAGSLPTAPAAAPARVPAAFITAAQTVAHHRDAGRWALLYRLLWRLTHETRHLLDLAIDDDVRRLRKLEGEVQRDTHRVHAFVRFRPVEDEDGTERFVAWYRPDHCVLALVAPFFVERFGTMRWSILTPDGSAHWDGTSLTFGPGLPRPSPPAEDEIEALWKTYYGAVFNPARTNLKAMRGEMPTRYWQALPETARLPSLLSDAPRRVRGMIEQGASGPSARPFVPASTDLEVLREAARACRGCPLHERATGTVFGEGPADAVIMLVGEQPGDQEDLQGAPFVGPAGDVLTEALRAAGLSRDRVYVTNAVKHFKWKPRGKRRIHQRPGRTEIVACHQWLEQELEVLDRAAVLVALGAVAGEALFGPGYRVGAARGSVLELDGRPVVPTIHPSALLRAERDGSWRARYDGLVADLGRAWELAG